MHRIASAVQKKPQIVLLSNINTGIYSSRWLLRGRVSTGSSIFHTIMSLKTMQLGSQSLTLKCYTMNLGNHLFWVQKVKVTHESQKHCRHGSFHSCECWLLLVVLKRLHTIFIFAIYFYKFVFDFFLIDGYVGMHMLKTGFIKCATWLCALTHYYNSASNSQVTTVWLGRHTRRLATCKS